MKITIVGAGRIGRGLAKALSQENQEVSLIENNEERIRMVEGKIDVKVIFGSGSDPEILKKANVAQADLVIAVTRSDETNIVVCQLADLFGAKRKIARVRKTSLSNELSNLGYQKFNIDEIINPELVAAQAIIKAIKTPGAAEVGDFENGRLLLRAFDISKNSPLCGLKIGELKDEDFPWPFLIVAIARNHEVIIPKGETSIQADDRLFVLLPPDSAAEFLTFINPEIRKPEKVIVYGATNVGEYVAKTLSGHVRDLILLEENSERAAEMANLLEGTKIIHGSPSDKDILIECGVEAADIFVAASNNDYANLISAVLAKKMGAKMTIIVTQQLDYMPIIDTLDVNMVVNPHILAVDQILSKVRGKEVSAVTKFLEIDAEALELIPEKDSPITKAPIKNIHFPKNAIIGAIFRESEVILAKGDNQIKETDKVIVFCQELALKKVQKLFTHK